MFEEYLRSIHWQKLKWNDNYWGPAGYACNRFSNELPAFNMRDKVFQPREGGGVIHYIGDLHELKQVIKSLHKQVKIKV